MTTPEHPPSRLVILDFSGTLSLDTVLFGRREALAAALHESGLAAFGVDTPRTFWVDIVEPTWQVGSTTPKGYRRSIVDRLENLEARRSQPDDREERGSLTPDDAAGAFVRLYLDASSIDPRWKPTLQALRERNDTVVVIATDHYVEMTDHLRDQLATMGIAAVTIQGKPSGADARAGDPHAVYIANSAGIGAHKSNRRFWQTVMDQLKIRNLKSVQLVDDFGFNESSDDRYADSDAVDTRREQTSSLIAGVFDVPVHSIPFFLQPAAIESVGRREAYLTLVARASRFLDQMERA